MTIEGETILTRDLSSGRVHKRVRLASQTALQTFEGCNLDAAGDFEVITEAELADVERSAFCHRCFPDPVEVSESVADA